MKSSIALLLWCLLSIGRAGAAAEHPDNALLLYLLGHRLASQTVDLLGDQELYSHVQHVLADNACISSSEVAQKIKAQIEAGDYQVVVADLYELLGSDTAYALTRSPNPKIIGQQIAALGLGTNYVGSTKRFTTRIAPQYALNTQARQVIHIGSREQQSLTNSAGVTVTLGVHIPGCNEDGVRVDENGEILLFDPRSEMYVTSGATYDPTANYIVIGDKQSRVLLGGTLVAPGFSSAGPTTFTLQSGTPNPPTLQLGSTPGGTSGSTTFSSTSGPLTVSSVGTITMQPYSNLSTAPTAQFGIGFQDGYPYSSTLTSAYPLSIDATSNPISIGATASEVQVGVLVIAPLTDGATVDTVAGANGEPTSTLTFFDGSNKSRTTPTDYTIDFAAGAGNPHNSLTFGGGTHSVVTLNSQVQVLERIESTGPTLTLDTDTSVDELHTINIGNSNARYEINIGADSSNQANTITIGGGANSEINLNGTIKVQSVAFSVESFQSTGNITLGDSSDDVITLKGKVRITANEASTDATTGSLVVAGGVGVGQDLQVAGAATVSKTFSAPLGNGTGQAQAFQIWSGSDVEVTFDAACPAVAQLPLAYISTLSGGVVVMAAGQTTLPSPFDTPIAVKLVGNGVVTGQSGYVTVTAYNLMTGEPIDNRHGSATAMKVDYMIFGVRQTI